MSRFQLEFRERLWTLKHPHLVLLKGVHKRKDNMIVVASAFYPTTLRNLTNSGRRIPYPFALRFAFQLCSAIKYLHQRGLAHFDVHASNVFMDNNQPPNIYLLDVGVGRAFSGSRPRRVTAPPELVSLKSIKEDQFTPAVDVYGLACVMWETLSGLNAEEAITDDDTDHEEPKEEIQSIGPFGERLPVPRKERLPPVLAVPPEFRSMLASCWAEDPEERPSVGVVLNEIKALILAARDTSAVHDDAGSKNRELGIGISKSTEDVILRRSRRLYGRQWIRALSTLQSLQDAEMSLEKASVLATYEKGSITQFRTNCALGVRRLQLFRIEELELEQGESTDDLTGLSKLQSMFIGRPGMSIAKAVLSSTTPLEPEGPHVNPNPGPESGPGVETAPTGPTKEKVVVLLDYVNGGTLQKVIIRGGCAQVPFLARVAWGILQGLGWLHRFNLAHGAMSPRHVLFSRDGQVFITGFDYFGVEGSNTHKQKGASKLLDGTGSSSATNSVNGTTCSAAVSDDPGKPVEEDTFGVKVERESENSASPEGNPRSSVQSEELNEETAAVLTDSGLSNGSGKEDSQSPKAPDLHVAKWHKLKGEYGFVPPETILEDSTSPAGDIWSLGMCLWAAATGTIPLQFETDVDKVKDIAANSSVTPELSQEIVSPEFVDFVSQCIQNSAGDRPSCEELLRHPFLSDYMDYPGIPKGGSDPDAVNAPPRDGSSDDLNKRLVSTAALRRIEQLVVRRELGVMRERLNSCAEDNHSFGELDLAKFAQRVSYLQPSFIQDRMQQRVVNKDPPPPLQEAEHLDREKYLSETFSKLGDPDFSLEVLATLTKSACNALGVRKIVTISGTSGQSEWREPLKAMLDRCGVAAIEASRFPPALGQNFSASPLARVFVLESTEPGAETLIDLAAALSYKSTDIVVYMAFPKPSVTNDRVHCEILSGRMALTLLAAELGGVESFQGPNGPLLATFASQACFRDIQREHKYDIFIGSPFEGDGTGMSFAQMLVSWLATKPEETMLAYARYDESQNVCAYLERLILLELSSSVLFYVVSGDARAYSLLVRAVVFALMGKPVIIVFGSERATDDETHAQITESREAFRRHVAPLVDRSVFIFGIESLDEAIETAVEHAAQTHSPSYTPSSFGTSSNVQLSEKSESLSTGSQQLGWKRQSSPGLRGTEKQYSGLSALPEMCDLMNDSRALVDLIALQPKVGPKFAPPQTVFKSLRAAATAFETTIDAIAGRGRENIPLYSKIDRQAITAFEELRFDPSERRTMLVND